jgi:hypothetical protein
MITESGPKRFVPRFTVSSSSRLWKGSAGTSGPGSLLYCEYLPPAVLVKELYAVVTHGQFGPTLRVRAPTLFWNLTLWFLSFALPLEHVTFLAREGTPEGEAEALGEAMDRWRPLLQAIVEVGAAAKRGVPPALLASLMTQ